MPPIKEVWVVLERTATGTFNPIEAHRTNDAAMAAANKLSSDFEIKKVDLKSETKAKTTEATPKSKKRPSSANAESDDELAASDASPAPEPTKRAKPAKQTLADGIPRALQGIKILFTGTMAKNRTTCEESAVTYGAKVVKKLEDADYIVVGTKPGDKKMEAIKQLGLETLEEDEFFEMLMNGVPREKRDRMAQAAAEQAANAANEESPKKKQKKQKL